MEEQDPTSVQETLTRSDKEEWRKVMEKEIDSLHSNNVWVLVKPPPNQKVVGSKWVFKRKVNADGEIERYKAHLVNTEIQFRL